MQSIIKVMSEKIEVPRWLYWFFMFSIINGAYVGFHKLCEDLSK